MNPQPGSTNTTNIDKICEIVGLNPINLTDTEKQEIQALIAQEATKAHLHLVTELIGQLPKIPEKSEWRKYNDGPLGRMRAIDEVTSLLEQKRQELGGV